jgi:hypothetical protein
MCAVSLRTPVSSPRPSRSILPPSGSGVSRVMPSSFSALEFTAEMCPQVRPEITG